MKMQTIEASYGELESVRRDFLERGRMCSELTIPSLLPKEGHTSSENFYTPYQGFGARAVNNLASKLLLALFPTNGPFFRYSADEADVQEAEEQDKDFRTKLEAGLKKREKVTMAELDRTPFRAPFFMALKLLITTGNALVFLAEDNNIRVYRLDTYVIRRDTAGNVLEIITKEMVAPVTLSAEVLAEAKIDLNEKSDDSAKDNDKDKEVAIYTRIRREANKWDIKQEINEQEIKSARGSYPLDASPWLPLRFSRVDGEDYGRGLVEEYFGDFVSIDGLRRDLTEGSAAMSKVVFLVKKNGQTRLKDVSSAENGDVKTGDADDVSVIQAEKRADFSIVRETYRDIEAELAKAFLLNSSISTQGRDRVTAEEIRFVARELEDTLGGVYTIQSQEFQLPFIGIFTRRLEKSNKLQKLPKGSVSPRIITGLSALGRTDDLEKMLQYAQIAAQAAALPPEVNRQTFLERAATALFIDQEGLIKSAAEVAQEQQKAQAMAIAEKSAPGAIQQAIKGAQENGGQEETNQGG